MQHPTPAAERHPVQRFGRFELQPEERRLLADGQPLAVGARAFDLLAVLIERAGQLVAKNELLERVWPGLVVEENNLQVQVSALRKLLGPNAVATIPGRGYRFELPIERTDIASTAIPKDTSAPLLPATTQPRDPPRARSNLPTRLPSLYGREHDLQKVKALLRKHVVVTIVGAGGIGKTRLAQAVAADVAVEHAGDYPDGVWWIELAALSDGALVPSAVARALDVQLTSDRAAAETVASVLAPQRLLVVLDNCEHLTDAVADLIETVCAAAPQVRLLVTSQETLKSTEEHVFRLGALAVPVDDGAADASRAGAVELFVARALAADPRFAMTAEHTSAVIEICRRLDGIPLAIELAAARVPLLGVEGIRTRLGERFNVLTAGSRVVLRRHQTLRATLEWSHGLLTPGEQTVFRRLGVFAGTFTLEAAQYVVHDAHIDTWAALDHLGALVDKSLVLAEGDPVPRYRLLETTRAYALERLAECGETEPMLRRHAEALLALLAPFESDDRQWLNAKAGRTAVEAELDNLRAAFAWLGTGSYCDDLAVRLAGVSYPVWFTTVQSVEGLERCLALRHHIRNGVPTADVARFWMTVARIGLYSTRRESFDAAMLASNLYRELGDDHRLYDALVYAAVQGARFATEEQMEEAIDEAARLERPDWRSRQRLQFARFRWFGRLGRFEDALACAQRQAAICREDGNLIGEHYAMSNITAVEIELGHMEIALEHAQASIAHLDAIGAGGGAGHLHYSVLRASTLLNRVDEALTAGRIAHALLLREGDEIRVFTPLALCIAQRGRLADAARICGFVEAELTRRGALSDSAWRRIPERLEALLTAGLIAEELTRLKVEGATMREAQAFELAVGDVA